MKQPADTRSSGRKTLANSVVALSSAAVIAVYAAGYARTAPAAGQVVTTATVPGSNDWNGGLPPSPAPTAIPTAMSTTTAAPTNAAAGGVRDVRRGGRQRPGGPGASGITVAPTATAALPTTSAPTAAAPAATIGAFRDGTYTGTGTSHHGSIGVTVTVQSGKIVAADITNCGTRYPCSRIAALPGQTIARQSAAVDVVSGATDSTNAYRAAVNAALAQAR